MTTKKPFILSVLIFAFIFGLINLHCSTAMYDKNNPASWKYFKIKVKSDDDNVFLNLQDDLKIAPHLESYILIVNIIKKGSEYGVIGEENTDGSYKFKWSDLSKENQDKLIKWNGKIN